MSDIKERFLAVKNIRDGLLQNERVFKSQLDEALKSLQSITSEQVLLETSTVALKDVKPLLSAQSIEQCEKLANSALEAIFQTSAKVRFNHEEGRFVVDEEEFSTDLKEGNGGGYQAVISFVFNIFLLMKMESRKFLVFDEAFTQISKSYFIEFFEFLKVLSKELEIDLLLITHDERIEEHMVDHIYVMENGKAIKQK